MFKYLKILIIAFFLFIPINLSAVEIITTPLILEDSLKKFTDLKFGVRSDATDTVDLDLGENYDLPGPPPGGLHGFFRIFNPVSNETTSSYLDYKAIPALRSEPVVFILHTFYTVEYLKFQWQPFDREYVDSAFIEDVYGAGIKFDMLELSEGRVDNPSIARYKISVWFSDKVAKAENTELRSFMIYPNPSMGSFFIDSELIGSEYEIYNSQMIMIRKGIIDSKKFEIDLSNNPQGVYYILVDHYGNKYFKKLIFIGS
jgi:hypothetical protein